MWKLLSENSTSKVQKICDALNNTFPSLSLFREEVALLYKPGLSKLSPTATFDFLSEMIIQIPEDEIPTQIPVLITELFNHLEFGSWQPAMNRITDLISAAKTLTNRQLLNQILQSFIIV